MAFSREPMIGSTSRNRRRTTGYTNPYAEAAAAQSSQRSVPQRYANPFAGQPANQPPQDPLVSAIAGGSMGGGLDDTVTKTGISTDAPGAFQEQTQGKVAGNTPANMPPPLPPPPPPPTMAQMQAPQTQNNLLPQGGMTSDQHQQALRMNNQPTGNAFDPNAGNAMALAQAARRPANQPFNDTVTPTGRSTEVATSAPRDLPSMAEAQGTGQAPTLRLGDALRSGMSYAKEMAARQGGGTLPAPFNDTVTPTGISTEVATSAPRDLPSMADAQGGGQPPVVNTPANMPPVVNTPANMPPPSSPAPTLSPGEEMAARQGTGQAPALSPQEQMAMAQQGIIDPITQAFSGATDAQRQMFEAQNQQLGNISNTLLGATDAQRQMFEAQNQQLGNISNTLSGATDAQQAMFDAQNQRFTDAISGATDAQRQMFDAQNRGFTDAISGATDAQRQMFEAQNQRLTDAISGGTSAQQAMFDAQNQQLGGISGILEQQLAMQQAQQAQADQQRQAQLDMEAAQRAQNEQQAQLDMQRAQRINDRTRDLLSGYGGGTSAQREMMIAQAPNFQQRELLRRAESRLQAPSGATDAQAAMFTAQAPTQLPNVSGFRSSYADAAAAQGDGGGATPTGYINPYADAAARQPDTGLRTFSSQPRFSPMRQAVDRPSDTLQQRLEQEYLGRISAADDPILASQIADQQLRQQEAEKGLIEQLSRYGVLRGGGDTAATLSRLAEGNERNRLALEAAAAQRRQGDLRDALSFDQARAQMGLAERGQTLQERRGQEDILNQQLSRQLQQAGVTGQFQGQDTLQAQQQRQAMDLAERGTALQEQIGGETILDRQQGRDIAAAGLTGRFGETDTLAGRELSLREELARSGDLRAQQAAESELFGQVVTGTDAPITTLQGQRIASDLDTAGLAREATEAGLTGQFRGGATATERALESQLASDDLARQIQEAGVTGQYGDQETLQSQVIESSLQNEALNRGLARAGATGLFREEGDTGAGTETLESRLRTAGLTGELGGQLTLGGRQAEQDLIGSILAASDPEFDGRNDALALALTKRLGEEFGDEARTRESFEADLKEIRESGTSLTERIRLLSELADKYNETTVTDALREIINEVPEEEQNALRRRIEQNRRDRTSRTNEG